MLQQKLINCGVICGIFIGQTTTMADENPVKKLQDRSANKRWFEMKTQHNDRQFNNAPVEAPAPVNTEEWSGLPSRAQRRTERQNQRMQRSDGIPGTMVAPAPTQVSAPSGTQNSNTQQSSEMPTAEEQTHFKYAPSSGIKVDQLLPGSSLQAIPATHSMVPAPHNTAASQGTTTPEYILPVQINEMEAMPVKSTLPVPQTAPGQSPPQKLAPQNESGQDEFEMPTLSSRLKGTGEIEPAKTVSVYSMSQPFLEAYPPPPSMNENTTSIKVPVAEVAETQSQPESARVRLTSQQVTGTDPQATVIPIPNIPKPINQISPFRDYQPEDSIDPNNPEGSRLCELSDNGQPCPPRLELTSQSHEARNYSNFNYCWYASNLTHNPLYFEDVTLERYGHSHGDLVQPFVSVGRFSVQLFGLPYQWVMHPPCEEVSPLGYYRPGEAAPKLHYQVPLNAEAAAATGAFYTGMFFLIP
jgi:hypothetical protein